MTEDTDLYCRILEIFEDGSTRQVTMRAFLETCGDLDVYTHAAIVGLQISEMIDIGGGAAPVVTIKRITTAATDIRSRYEDPEIMGAYLLDRAVTLRERKRRLEWADHVAADPQGRFGLSIVAADVRAVIGNARIVIDTDILPIRRKATELRAEGLAWDEVWDLEFMRESGFGFGDSVLLQIR